MNQGHAEHKQAYDIQTLFTNNREFFLSFPWAIKDIRSKLNALPSKQATVIRMRAHTK